MFDVLVYLYENYWRPDACPDHEQLTRKLSAVGFETDEIQEALSWLDGLTATAEMAQIRMPAQDSMRVYQPRDSRCWARTRSASSAFSNRPACCRPRCARW
jgi:Smg protein